MRKILAFVLSFSILLILTGTTALAQQGVNTDGQGVNNNQNTGTIKNPLAGNGNLVTLFNSVIDNVLLPLGAVLAVIFLILTGFKFVTAQGNEDKLGEAKRMLLYTVIGTAILLGARVLGGVVSTTISSLKSG